jgi:hypothetical protein
MGLNDEYSRDAYQFEQVYDSDDSDEFDYEVDPETWESLYSEELFDGWTIFQEYIYSNYLSVKNTCTFSKFCDLVIRPDIYSSSEPFSNHAIRAWNDIKRVKVVREKVLPENFYSWFTVYVN